jgi:hypothetical protein
LLRKKSDGFPRSRERQGVDYSFSRNPLLRKEISFYQIEIERKGETKNVQWAASRAKRAAPKAPVSWG